MLVGIAQRIVDGKKWILFACKLTKPHIEFSLGPFTGNFPNNDAFSKMDPDRLNFLVQPENIDELRQVLLYHVLPGLTLSTEFTAGPKETLFGEKDVEVSLNPLRFDSSGVIEVDTPGFNGVFNVLDAVMDPFAARK